MSYLWHAFLYDPLLNALIALYNSFAGQNLGIALVELTVLIRILLLPFTVIVIRARSRYARLEPQVKEIEAVYKNDPIRRKEKVRGLLKQHRIHPWAKAAMLGLQFLVLVVLYRVFVDAVRHNNFTGLYTWIEAPDFLNRNFFNFDLAAHSWMWAAVIGLLLFIELWIEERKHPESVTNGEVVYRFAFPIMFFLVLYALPTGKSIFVLTSILFSLMIDGGVKVLRRTNAAETT
ncbi:MAG: YidC/Oxa1 family membrane protein insertase [bacterium]|nr:YidC/Oxa1 family membrane protein insertase [bacterium]